MMDNSSANEPWIELVLMIFAPLMLIVIPIMLILAPFRFLARLFGFGQDNGGDEL